MKAKTIEDWLSERADERRAQFEAVLDCLYKGWRRRNLNDTAIKPMAKFLMGVDDMLNYYQEIEESPLPTPQEQKEAIKKTLNGLKNTRGNLKKLFFEDNAPGLVPQWSSSRRFEKGQMQLNHDALRAAADTIAPIDTLIECCEQSLNIEPRSRGQKTSVIRHEDKINRLKYLYHGDLGRDPNTDPQFRKVVGILLP